jgi:hypothetical protein
MHPWVPGVPERIRGIVPDARMIYLVRDPIERMVSQYVHHRTRGYTRKTISQLFSVDRFEESDYVLFSRYAFQLGRLPTVLFRVADPRAGPGRPALEAR